MLAALEARAATVLLQAMASGRYKIAGPGDTMAASRIGGVGSMLLGGPAVPATSAAPHTGNLSSARRQAHRFTAQKVTSG